MDKNYAKYLLDKTRQDYNSIAGEFSRTRWNIWAEFGIFRQYVEDGDKILDVGCGNGRLLELLKDKNIEYAGIDNSENLLKIAKKKYPQNKFLLADALNMPFQRDSFDKIFFVAVLHNIPSNEFRRQSLREIKRVLNPKGILILTVWDIWRKEAITSVLKHLFLKLIGKSQLDFKDIFVPWGEKIMRYYHYFTKNELIKLVKTSGFRIKRFGVVKNKTGKRSNIYLIAEKE